MKSIITTIISILVALGLSTGGALCNKTDSADLCDRSAEICQKETTDAPSVSESEQPVIDDERQPEETGDTVGRNDAADTYETDETPDCAENGCGETTSVTAVARQDNGNEKTQNTDRSGNDTEKTEPITVYDGYNAGYAEEVIRLVNVERAKYGLSALSENGNAASAAKVRAKEIVSLFSHTRPNGKSCFTVADEIGFRYRSAGENIAYGQRSPAEVVNAWMNSEGHRANILSTSFSGIGVACYEQGGVLYWAQFFIG